MEHIVKTQNGYDLFSPKGSVCVSLTEEGGRLFYALKENGRAKFGRSALGITIGKTENTGVDYSAGNRLGAVAEEETENREFTVYGRQEKRVENSVCYTVAVENEACAYALQIKVFDDGAAFRYLFPEAAGTYVMGEHTEFTLEDDCTVYASFGCRHPGCNTALNGHDALCYECTYAEYDPKEKFVPGEYEIKRDYHNLANNPEFYNYVLLPMTVKFRDGSFGALMEAEVYNYSGVSLRPYGGYRFGLNTWAGAHQFHTFCVKEKVTTPWRILTLGKDLNELYNNSIIHAVVKKADKDFSFVKPGRSAWHWHVEVLRTIERSYQMMVDYTMAAAKMGYEYNTVDGGWEKWLIADEDGKELSAYDSLKKLVALGKKYGVEQFCWAGYLGNPPMLNPASFDERGDSPFSSKEILDIMSDCGAIGAKIDFFRSESDLFSGVDLYEMLADYCADKKLMVNFHGCTKPTGLSAKYPNEVSREGIKGMENFFYNTNNYKDIAYALSTLTFVRGLAGHGDWTPLIHDGFGLAATLLTDSPLSTISADPKELVAHPAKDFLKQLPASFDKTTVLPYSEFGKCIAMAKEKDGTYFVGGMNAEGKTAHHTVKLADFLGEGIYRMELWYDSPEGLRCEYRRVQAFENLELDVPAYRGFVAVFKKLFFSYHGGEITEPVSISTAFGVDAVYYTTDGTDPATSESRMLYRKPLALDASCTLWAVAYKDDKIVQSIKHRFNKIED